MTQAAVELEGLVKEYGSRRVLEIDCFSLEGGRISAVTGPNGSGKTTLLSLVALLEEPTAGSISLFGEKVDFGSGVMRRLRRRVVMVHDRPWMFRTTVRRNVTYGLTARGMSRHDARKKASAALEEVAMTHAAEWPAQRLSAGETRRVALARALVLGSELVCLDEPLDALDAQSTPVIEGLIRSLPERGVAVLLATHRLDTAFRLADDALSLVDGRLSEALPGNHFTGVIEEEGGEPVMRIAPTCVLRLATDVRGAAHVAIDPRTVIVSREKPVSSARNTFPGRITALHAEAEKIRLTVDVGIPLVVVVTERSFREMDLRLGEEVTVLFKATSLSVFGGVPG